MSTSIASGTGLDSAEICSSGEGLRISAESSCGGGKPYWDALTGSDAWVGSGVRVEGSMGSGCI